MQLLFKQSNNYEIIIGHLNIIQFCFFNAFIKLLDL